MSQSEAPASLTPPSTQESAMADTPMLEAPATTMEHAPPTTDQVAAAAGRADTQQGGQHHQQEQQSQQQPQQSYPAGEPPPPPTETSPTTPFLREPISRQSTPRQHETPLPHDRIPPPLSSYPTAPDSLPQTPHPSMSAPWAPRATTPDSIPHLYSYPTAPVSASQTPQPPTPQQGRSAAAWVVPPAASPAPRITFDDYLSLSEITFEWGDSYDDKDWKRLHAILAPTLMIDYTLVNGHMWPSLSAEEFVRTMSHIGFVGDPLVHTQHHIGASKFRKISATEATGHHQLRAAHQRYAGRDMKSVVSKGHGHAMVQLWYRKVEGSWKLAGLKPVVRWNEVESGGVFKGF